MKHKPFTVIGLIILVLVLGGRVLADLQLISFIPSHTFRQLTLVAIPLSMAGIAYDSYRNRNRQQSNY